MQKTAFFKKKRNFGHIEDSLQNFNEVPRSWQFSEKLFIEAVTGVALQSVVPT